MLIHVNLDFPIIQPLETDFGNFCKGLDFVLEVFRVFLQLRDTVFSGEIDAQNGKLIEVEVHDHGIHEQIIGEFTAGFVHCVFYILERFLYVHPGIEFHENIRVVLGGYGSQLLNAVDPVNLLLQRPGDQVLHVHGGIARIERLHENVGHVDLGKHLHGHGGV